MVDPLDHQRLLGSIVAKYLGRGLSEEDLFAEGQIGLLIACRKYDPTLGFEFSTYATWWVRQTISRAIASQVPLLRVPLNVVELIRGKTDPATPRQAEAIARGKAARRRHMNESSLKKEDGAASLESIAYDHREDAIGRVNAAHDVAVLMRVLTPRQADVICMRYGLDGDGERTLDEIGIACGSTWQAAQQSERKAMEKLRTRAHVESRRASA